MNNEIVKSFKQPIASDETIGTVIQKMFNIYIDDCQYYKIWLAN